MPTSHLSRVLHQLRRAVLAGAGAEMTDGQLLERFISRREEPALEALLQRHGPMVWGVCRRILPNHHDAEDAFQATFLILVRKATSVVPREMVGNWLYGVARQTALKARAMTAKRRARESQVTEMPEPAVAEQDLGNHLLPLLDQEVSRLPDKYRAPLVLCDLEGKTRKEAARQLGWPEGTVASRLARARARLAKRLARHGLAVSTGSLAAALSHQATSACAPASVVSSTIQAATLLAAGQAAGGVISAPVAALTQEVLKAMLLSQLKVVMAVCLVIAVPGVGVSLFGSPQPPGPLAERTQPEGAGGGRPPGKGYKQSSAGLVASLKGWNARQRTITFTVVTNAGTPLDVTYALHDKVKVIRERDRKQVNLDNLEAGTAIEVYLVDEGDHLGPPVLEIRVPDPRPPTTGEPGIADAARKAPAKDPGNDKPSTAPPRATGTHEEKDPGNDKPSTAPPRATGTHEEAAALFHAARRLLAQGKVDEAARLAERVKGMTDARWRFFEDNPDKLLQDVERARTAGAHGEAAVLLPVARRLLAQGKFDEAAAIARLLNEMSDVRWSLFEDSPDKILKEVERARVRSEQGRDPASPLDQIQRPPAKGNQGNPAQGQEGPAATSPDGTLQAVATGRAIIVLDARTGKEVRRLLAHQDTVTALAFAPDGKSLVSGGRDKAVVRWDLSTGRVLWKYQGTAPVVSVTHSRDGRTLTIQEGKAIKRFLEAATGEEVQPLRAP